MVHLLVHLIGGLAVAGGAAEPEHSRKPAQLFLSAPWCSTMHGVLFARSQEGTYYCSSPSMPSIDAFFFNVISYRRVDTQERSLCSRLADGELCVRDNN